ncbi:DUF6118 family protein [Caulobacter segnis]
MDTDTSPAESFELLRTEVALLRRAVEGLAATHIEPIDYGPTLEKLSEDMQTAGKLLQAMTTSPALSQSLYSLNIQLDDIRNVTATKARQEWMIANSELGDHARTLSQIIGSAQAQERQFRWLLGTWVVAFVAGILACTLWGRVFG